MKPTGPDPTTLPGRSILLRFENLAERQRFEAVIASVQARPGWADRPNISEALMAYINDAEAAREAAPKRSPRARREDGA